MALTPEEEKRKETFTDVKAIAWLKAGAEVFFGGDEDAAWRAVFKVEDEEQKSDKLNASQPASARIHLKATHQ